MCRWAPDPPARKGLPRWPTQPPPSSKIRSLSPRTTSCFVLCICVRVCRCGNIHPHTWKAATTPHVDSKGRLSRNDALFYFCLLSHLCCTLCVCVFFIFLSLFSDVVGRWPLALSEEALADVVAGKASHRPHPPPTRRLRGLGQGLSSFCISHRNTTTVCCHCGRIGSFEAPRKGPGRTVTSNLPLPGPLPFSLLRSSLPFS